MTPDKKAPAAPVQPAVCPYCGIPLDSNASGCVFCPERRKENQEGPDNGGNEPLKARAQEFFEDEAEAILPRDPEAAARFMGFGR